MKDKKPIDTKAADIEFGIELETFIPTGAGISVGDYHRGNPVTFANSTTGERVEAPTFNSQFWKAERDGSIQYPDGYAPCEFISPVLKGEAGLAALSNFIKFAAKIGAKVNSTCGCHITVGIRSVLGPANIEELTWFIRKLVRHSHEHQWAIYGQTGTGRHTIRYAHPIDPQHDMVIDRMIREKNTTQLQNMAPHVGRGMVNLQKAFLGERGAIEFRAFAGTLNEKKIFHHIATCFALMRKSAACDRVTSYKLDPRICKINTAPKALERLWHLMGWRTSSKTVELAYGLFGPLYTNLRPLMNEAMKMAEKFEQNYPGVTAASLQPRPVQPAPAPIATEPATV